jgi:DNA-binding NarL/FixJ family response regulator
MRRRKPIFYVLEENPVYREIVPRCLDATSPDSLITTFDHPGDMLDALAVQPDVVVSEYSFAATEEYNGSNILTAVKEKSPHTKVIFLTAHHNIIDAITSIQSGALDYIPKSKTALDTLIQRMLAVKKHREAIRKSELILIYVKALLLATLTAMAVLLVWYHWV